MTTQCTAIDSGSCCFVERHVEVDLPSASVLYYVCCGGMIVQDVAYMGEGQRDMRFTAVAVNAPSPGKNAEFETPLGTAEAPLSLSPVVPHTWQGCLSLFPSLPPCRPPLS